MIKVLIGFSIMIYLIIAFAWYLIFTYQFTFRMKIRVKEDIYQKDFKGCELAILCLFWVIVMPISIKDMIQKDKDEEE